MEKWDLYDENRKPLNRTIIRGELEKEGQYHIVAGIWIVNSNNQTLLTLRDKSKKQYPNCWENTVGSIVSGETSRQGAVRELLEETGIVINEEELFYLGTYKGNTHFHDTYIARKDIEIEELALQKGETADAKWVSMDELDEMIKDKKTPTPLEEILILVREKLEEFIDNK